MLDATMATPRKTTPRKTTPTNAKTPAKGSTRRPTKAPARLTFAETGRAAAKAAQRVLLLAELETQAWNMTATAEALGMGRGPAVIRALKELAPDEYERAKHDGRVSPANRRDS